MTTTTPALASAPVAPETVAARTDAPSVAAMRDRTWGIEIETVGVPRRLVAEAVARGIGPAATIVAGNGYAGSDTYKVAMNDGTNREFTVMRDGSLGQGPRGTGEIGGAEIVSPIMRGTGEIEIVQRIIREVRAAGALSSPDHNCGIHVHVGCSDLGPAGIGRLAKTVRKVEDLLDQALAIAPGRRHYCAAHPERFVAGLANDMSASELRAHWYGTTSGGCPTRYDSSRYHGCNINAYFVRGAVEFRWFNGTLHAGEVKAYVQFCLAMVGKAATSKSASAKKTPTEKRGHFERMRLFLAVGLGLNGDEFATCREHLTKRLPKKAPVAAPATPAAPPAAPVAA